MAWSVDTQADQIRGELECNPDAAGGTVPARLENIIIECGRGLWNGSDWRFRWKQGTLTTVAGIESAVLPDDFGEMCQRWLRRNNGEWGNGLVFVEDVTRWQEEADKYDSTDTNDWGQPRVASIVQDLDDKNDYSWEIILTPIPDTVYTYKFWYLTIDPWTGGEIGEDFANSATPLMPPLFHEGWHLYSLARCQRAFKKPDPDSWKETWAHYRDWLGRQFSENNETLTMAQDPIVDGYQDFYATSSTDFTGVGGLPWL